ncbi:peroxisomal membrane protein PEX14 [Patella vulgata]|uniref:peroxisomal membrane protein PEX14 n=1 Tax=Patella vulgata TaxID=6465 RepID=UPI0021803657|nr:peroxisomal membrane protein PEX14 [Patella vulgata]
MAEESNKISEVTKEILAPDEEPRENLVSTAVKFLQNPKVQSSSLTHKKAFLEKKGLTKQEIDLAIDRSGISKTESRVGLQSPPLQQSAHPANNIVPYNPSQYELSRWEKARAWTSSALIVAAVAYAGYHFYRTYIKPLIFGQISSENRLERLEKQIQEIQTETIESTKQIQESLKTIQTVLTQQQIANSERTLLKQHDLNGIGEIKTEIQSLKGLLLNRRQFAPVPSVSPVLPSWQLPASSSSTSQTQDDQKDDDSSRTDLSNDNDKIETIQNSTSQTDLSSPVDDPSVLNSDEKNETKETIKSVDLENIESKLLNGDSETKDLNNSEIVEPVIQVA